MHFAVQGCAHGQLSSIYSTLLHLSSLHSLPISFLLLCGDLQTIRFPSDLSSIALPSHHPIPTDFQDYFNGIKKVPILTLVIGGNHESWDFLHSMPYGGWLTHNMWFLGRVGVVNVCGMRIAGISGIYKPYDYDVPLSETIPLNERTKRSVYHIRRKEIDMLSLVRGKVDVVMSHDWPKGMAKAGELRRGKGYLEEEDVGCAGLYWLMERLKPRWWFSAHHHVKCAVRVGWEEGETKWLALDKVGVGREFLQVVEAEGLGGGSDVKVEWDEEWLRVLRATMGREWKVGRDVYERIEKVKEELRGVDLEVGEYQVGETHVHVKLIKLLGINAEK